MSAHAQQDGSGIGAFEAWAVQAGDGAVPQDPDAALPPQDVAPTVDDRQPWDEENDLVWREPGAGLAPWQILMLFLTAVAIVAGVAVYIYSRKVADRTAPVPDDDGEWPLPPLVIPARLAPDGAARSGPDLREVAAPSVARPLRAGPAQRAAAGPAALARLPVDAPEGPGEAVQAGPIRFHRPPEGTLQLLPGRLDILSGDDKHEEIRFVRVAGQDAVVTFGRSEGEPHLHVQLQSRTVSRLHASMRFDNGQWHIANLSHTNPVVLNGVPMTASGGRPIVLADGDQIEMGEVIFRFRSR
jgi:hypothetical protein